MRTYRVGATKEDAEDEVLSVKVMASSHVEAETWRRAGYTVTEWQEVLL